MNTEIEITTPKSKKVNLKDKNLQISDNAIVTALIIIIAIIVPCLFLPYRYEKTNQIIITYFSTIITALAIFSKKMIETIKHNRGKQKIVFFTKSSINFVDICMLIYSILIMVSAITSRYYPYTITSGKFGRFEGMLTLYIYMLIFYLTYRFFKLNKNILPAVACSSLIVSTVGIVEAMGYYIFRLEDSCAFMASSSFGNPNFFSSYLSMFLPIYMLVFLKKGQPFYLITSVITFGALVCTKTLGGYITFVIYFILILIYAISKKVPKKRIFSLVLTFITIFTLLNICTQNTYIKEFISISSEGEKLKTGSDDFATGRGYIYKVSLDIILQHPMLGIGPDSLGGYFMENYYSKPDYNSNLLYDKAHCEYLQIAVCTGIPSLICYIAIISTVGIKLLKKFFGDTDNLTVFAVGISILSYLIQAVGNISVTHVAPIFWIMLAVGFGLCRNNSYKQENEE